MKTAINADIVELPPPSHPEIFESLCLDLWKDVWKDLGAQKNGRRGQKQDGVDIFGKSDGKWEGVQCKQKDGLLWKTISIAELEKEVQAALQFHPPLNKFILATTGVRDNEVQKRARLLTEEHKAKNLFTVEVWSWREIWPELCRRPQLFQSIRSQYWQFLDTHTHPLHQLPPTTLLIGRDDELKHLNDLFCAQPAVPYAPKWYGLHGMAGVGKTAFAIAFAYHAKEQYIAQFYFDMRGADLQNRKPLEAIDVMRSVIRAFHPLVSMPDCVNELTALYRSVLHDAGQTMLVLDNISDDGQIAPLLPPPNCLLIATSRRKFSNPAFVEVKIDCLCPEKSEELLVKLAPRLLGYEKEVAALCGYLPLALTVFAGVANAHSIIHPKQIVGSFREKRLKLVAVEAVFQVSYDLLSVALRHRWCSLAVFPADFELLAVSAVWGKLVRQPNLEGQIELRAAALAETQVDLQILVNYNLVAWNNDLRRFHLHDLIHQFCGNKLTDFERVEGQYCYSAHFCDVLNRANALFKMGGAYTELALKIFDSEVKNIGSGHGWAIDGFNSVDFSRRDSQMRKAVAILCSAYPIYGANLFKFRLLPKVRLHINDIALRASEELGDLKAQVSHLSNLGQAYVYLSEPKKAINCFNSALKIARASGNFASECNALGNLASASIMVGDIEAALSFCILELALRKNSKDRKGEGLALGTMGAICQECQKFDDAIAYFAQQRQIAVEMKDLESECTASINMGTAFGKLGNKIKAVENLEHALLIAGQLRDLNSQGSILNNLGTIAAPLEPERAIKHFKDAMEKKESAGDLLGIASTKLNLGRVYLQLGDPVSARFHASAALRIYEELNDSQAEKVIDLLAKLEKVARAFQ